MLDRSGSPQAFSDNIKKQTLKGIPANQAFAIANAVQGTRKKTPDFEAKRQALKSLANPFTRKKF